MSAARRVEPEWLDRLPAEDAAARRSRLDLAWLNSIMLHPLLLARILKGERPPKVLLDLGGGDGIFLLRLARRLAPRWPGVRAIVIDRHDIVSTATQEGFASLGWRIDVLAGDVFGVLSGSDAPKADIGVANLFLHHFEDRRLAELLPLVAARTQLFAACEPRRAALSLAASRLIFALGCNAVSRHDAPASVRAGFLGDELTRLWPAGGWACREAPAGLFSHAFVARRSGG